jgi:hypothetical protein
LTFSSASAIRFATGRVVSMRNLTCGILATLVLLATSGEAFAGFIYSNVNAITFDVDAVSAVGPQADSFSTGSSAFNMTDVMMVLNGSPSPGSISIQLFSDATTSPGFVLSTIAVVSDNLLPSNPQVLDFHLTTPYMLSANTRYWIELSSTNNSTANWAFSFDTTGVGVANEYYANALGVFPNIDGPYQMAVEGNNTAFSAAPEPASVTLILVGLTCLCTLGYGKNRLRKGRSGWGN